MKKTIAIIVIYSSISGCVLDSLSGTVKNSSEAYGTVKNAKSLGVLASGVKDLTETRKIKAELAMKFIEDLNTMIKLQPIDSQAELIRKSIDAKVAIAENTRYKGWLEMVAFIFLLSVFVKGGKYVFNRFKPKMLSATYKDD